MELAVLIAGKSMLLLTAVGLMLIPMAILLPVGLMIDKLSQLLFERYASHILGGSKTQPTPEERGESQVVKGAEPMVGGVRK